MTIEPKKISFGFSKISKKTNIIQPKKEDSSKNNVQFIECLEGKSIKLIGGDEKAEELPIIPMLNGNLLRDSIKEVIKSRSVNKNVDNKIIENNSKPLTLDEIAAKELLEGEKKDIKTEDSPSTVLLNTQVTIGDKESSTLDDYDKMPITNFGLAMLRGMGWDPKKGIGLNEKIVSPLAPSLRPKGMGLGADRVPAAKSISANGEVLIMKKGAAVKVLSGPYINLYGKIEGFDELPGRLLVRISSQNIVVSLNEIMVQLISLNEYSKNVECKQNDFKIEKKRLNNAETVEIITSRNIREDNGYDKNPSRNKSVKDDTSISDEDNRHRKHQRNKEIIRHRAENYRESSRNSNSDNKKNRKHQRSRYSSSSSRSPSPVKYKKKNKRESSSSSISEEERRRTSSKSKHHSSHKSKKTSYSREKKHTSKHKNYNKI